MKNLLVYIWHLAGLVAVSTSEGAELQRGAGDATTRTSPRMTCGLLNAIQINSDSIALCILGINIVFRRQAVLNQTLPLAGGASVELPASTIGACAKLTAEAGFATFEFNSKCVAYDSSICFKKCDTSCDRFIFVTDNSCSKEPRLVPLDEAPWKPGPYSDTREYMLEKLIYLDESNVSQPFGTSDPYDPDSYRKGFSYATHQNGSIFSYSHFYVDLSTCLYHNGDAGLPTLVSPVFFNHTLIIYHFMESCGDTIRLPPAETLDNALQFPILLYSHRGFGCSEFPGKTYVDCTVNIEYDDGSNINLFLEGLNGPDGRCDGFNLTKQTEDEERDICGGTSFLNFPNGGRIAFTLRGSAPDTRLGFFVLLRTLVA